MYSDAPTITLTSKHRPKETPMWATNPYLAEQLIRDRQERLRQISQQTHLRHQARRARRQQQTKT